LSEPPNYDEFVFRTNSNCRERNARGVKILSPPDQGRSNKCADGNQRRVAQAIGVNAFARKPEQARRNSAKRLQQGAFGELPRQLSFRIATHFFSRPGRFRLFFSADE